MSKRPYYVSARNKLLQLYLIGLKGVVESQRSKPQYGRYKSLLFLGVSLAGLKYMLYNWQPEFETLEQPNLLIPGSVYRSREEHYRYWELSRLARGKSTTFSYYDYDPVNDFVFYVARDGEQTSENYNLALERLEAIDNPAFETYIRAYRTTGDSASKAKANKLIAYNRHMHNGLDLKNYLGYRTVTLGDWLRCAYYTFMVKLGLTNYYRYDHIVSRPDAVYEYEKLKLALNLPHKSELNKVEKLARVAEEYKRLKALN